MQRRPGQIKASPFGFDRPSYAEAVVEDFYLRERIVALEQRGKLLAAGKKAGQIESVFAPVTGKTSVENAAWRRSYP